MEKLPAFSLGFYYTTITTIELNMVMSHKLSYPNIFMLWHDRLGHPRSTMMRRIIENSHKHPLKNQKIILFSDYPCTTCSQGKLIVRPSHTKVLIESPTFLERIQGDICGPIHPPCGPISLFYGANRCLISMVTCLLVIYPQCCIFQAPCSDHKVTRTFSRLSNQEDPSR